MAVEIRLLGRVDALIDGRSLPLRGSKLRGVLAMLALRANRTVGADALIDGLWGDRPPQSAAKNVQYYVSQLRKALASDDSGASIVTHGRGYELRLPQDAVDAARFEHLVERARREAEQGIADGSAQGALELWRGAPLADVAEEPFAGAEIRRLEELHLRAIELAIDAELAAGRHDEAIGRLEALIAEHPAHERFHAQRMLALYRAGRQSEAVEGYRAAHRTLAEEIGVEPGPELRELQEAILRRDPALDARPPPRELPRQLEGGSPLIAGRDRELRWLRKRWQEAEAGRTSVALVSGPGGIGKTRLAAELAAEVQPEAAVLYAAGSGAPDAALEVIRGAQESERPTLLVLDDADDASPALLEAAAALAEKPRDITSAPPRSAPRRAGPAGVRRRGAEACAPPPAGGGRRRDRRALRAGRRHGDAGGDADGRERGGAASGSPGGQRLGAGAGGGATGGRSGHGRRRSRWAAHRPSDGGGKRHRPSAHPRADPSVRGRGAARSRRRPRCARSAASRRSTQPTPSTSSAASGSSPTWWRAWSAPP